MKLYSQFRTFWLDHHCTTSIQLAYGVIVIATLSSCVMSNGLVSDTSSHKANQMVMIGVPILLGGFGSAVPVSKDYMLTAKHVAQLSWDLDVIHHPHCDLSLVRRSTEPEDVPSWGLIYPDQAVSHHGHSVLGNSIKGEGKYLQDVIDTNTDCLYSLSDAPVMSGMSGGPVFNQDGDIVGITVAIVHNPEDLENLRPAERYSQFVPATLIFDWLDAMGIETTSANPALDTIQVSEYVASLNRPGKVAPQIATTHPAPSLNKQVADPSSPITDQEQAEATSVSALSELRTPVNSPLRSPVTPVAPDSDQAGALSGLRGEADKGQQLTLKKENKVPTIKE